jgi:hypothetical protein
MSSTVEKPRVARCFAEFDLQCTESTDMVTKSGLSRCQVNEIAASERAEVHYQ